MSIDENTAAKVAKLARIEVESQDLKALAKEFNDILGFIEQLNEVDVEGIEPMTSVCLLYTSPSPRDQRGSRMPSSA